MTPRQRLILDYAARTALRVAWWLTLAGLAGYLTGRAMGPMF